VNLNLRFFANAIRRLSALGLFVSLPFQAWAAWTSSDIGEVTMRGNSQVESGGRALTIKGGGWDIWDTTDAFHYVYQSVSGDAELIAHLDSLDNTADWAKVGLMVRQDNNESSVFAMMVQSPIRGDGFISRAAPHATCSLSQYQNNGAPVWLKIVKDGTIVSGYDSSDGVNWTCRGAIRLPLDGPVEIGMADCSRTTDSLCAATFDHIALTSSTSFAPVSPWVDKDVGNTPIAGGSHCEKDELNLFATGHEIWDNADSFHFLARPFKGDGSISIRVANIMNTDPGAPAGIMFREDDSAGSRQVTLFLTPQDGLMFFRRKEKDINGLALGISAITPLWLKLTREGDVFSALISLDGATWKFVGKDTVPMNPSLEFGVVTSPSQLNRLGEASFDHLRVQMATP
jgi:regulation of enolase protein 1 (concanavalin A-like superfamily)